MNRRVVYLTFDYGNNLTDEIFGSSVAACEQAAYIFALVNMRSCVRMHNFALTLIIGYVHAHKSPLPNESEIHIRPRLAWPQN